MTTQITAIFNFV